jgi:hypothetical protein
VLLGDRDVLEDGEGMDEDKRVSAGAILCFGLTIVLTIADRVPAATLMAGLFIVMVLLNYLPHMESFKAFSVESKMRAKLSDAEDILARLKAAARSATADAHERAKDYLDPPDRALT